MDRDAAPPFCPRDMESFVMIPREPAGSRAGTHNASDRARRRRLAAQRRAETARVLVCRTGGSNAVSRIVRGLGYRVSECRTLEDALHETIGAAPPDAAVLDLATCDAEVEGLLKLLRRALPRTPFVLVLGDASPTARIATLAVRPFYVTVPPVATDELNFALRDAIAWGRRHHG
jgi:DNA-binding NtrC family response regulator